MYATVDDNVELMDLLFRKGCGVPLAGPPQPIDIT